MSNPSQNHNRKSIRLKNYDYSQPGAYFITLVTHRREALFGNFSGESIQLSAFGKMITKEWLKLPKRFRIIQIDAFVVMPNHFHGIIAIAEPGQDTGVSGINHDPGYIPRVPTNERFGAPITGSLPTIMRSFKSSTTLRYRLQTGNSGNPLWQRNYYEHVNIYQQNKRLHPK